MQKSQVIKECLICLEAMQEAKSATDINTLDEIESQICLILNLSGFTTTPITIEDRSAISEFMSSSEKEARRLFRSATVHLIRYCQSVHEGEPLVSLLTTAHRFIEAVMFINNCKE